MLCLRLQSCIWNINILYRKKEGSNEQQDEARTAVQEWDRNIDSLELENSKRNMKCMINKKN
jgi:hypothetical protein